MTVGTLDGTEEGFTVGHVGLREGTIVGLLEVGFCVGDVGANEGSMVGSLDGSIVPGS